MQTLWKHPNSIPQRMEHAKLWNNNKRQTLQMPQMRKTKQNRHSHTTIRIHSKKENRKNTTPEGYKYRKAGIPRSIQENESENETKGDRRASMPTPQ